MVITEMEIEMTNQYEEQLTDELVNDLEGAACSDDWREFWGVLTDIREAADVQARFIAECEVDDRDFLIDDAVVIVSQIATGTRADLPSLEAYISEQIRLELSNVR